MSNIQDASHEYHLPPRMHVDNLYKEGKHTAAIRNLYKHEEHMTTVRQLHMPMEDEQKRECIENNDKRTPVVIARKLEKIESSLQCNDMQNVKRIDDSNEQDNNVVKSNLKQDKSCKKYENNTTSQPNGDNTSCERQSDKCDEDEIIKRAEDLALTYSISNESTDCDDKSATSSSPELNQSTEVSEDSGVIKLESSILKELQFEADLFEDELKMARDQSLRNQNLQEQTMSTKSNDSLHVSAETKISSIYSRPNSTQSKIIEEFENIIREKDAMLDKINTKWGLKFDTQAKTSSETTAKDKHSGKHVEDEQVHVMKQESRLMERKEHPDQEDSSEKFKRNKFFNQNRSHERKFKISAINKETWIGKKALIGNRLTFQMSSSDINNVDKIGDKKLSKKKSKIHKKLKYCKKACRNEDTSSHNSVIKETDSQSTKNKSIEINPLQLAKELGLYCVPKVQIHASSVSNLNIPHSPSSPKSHATISNSLSNNDQHTTNEFDIKKKSSKKLMKTLRRIKVFVFNLSNGWYKIVIYSKKFLKERTFVLLHPPCLHQQLSSMKDLVEFSKKYPKAIQANNLKELNFDLPTDFDTTKIEEDFKKSSTLDNNLGSKAHHSEDIITPSRENKTASTPKRSYLKRYHGEKMVVSSNPKKNKKLRKRAKVACERNNKWLASFTIEKILKLERLFFLTPCMPTFMQISQWSIQLGLEEQDVWQWFRSKWNAKIQYEASKTRELNDQLYHYTVYGDVDPEFYPSHELKRFELEYIQDTVLPNKDFVIEYENAEDDFDEMNEEFILTSNVESYDELSNNYCDIIEIKKINGDVTI